MAWGAYARFAPSGARSLRGCDGIVGELVRGADRLAEQRGDLRVGQLFALRSASELDAERRAAGDLLKEEDGSVLQLGLVPREIRLRAAGAHRLIQVEQDTFAEAREVDLDPAAATRAEARDRRDRQQHPAGNVDGIERVIAKAFRIRFAAGSVRVPPALLVRPDHLRHQARRPRARKQGPGAGRSGHLERLAVEADEAHFGPGVEHAQLDQAAPEPRQDLQGHRTLDVVGHDPTAVHEAESVVIALRVDALAGDRHGAGRLARWRLQGRAGILAAAAAKAAALRLRFRLYLVMTRMPRCPSPNRDAGR